MERRAVLIGSVATMAVVEPAANYNRGGTGHLVSADLSWVSHDCHVIDERTATVKVRFQGTTRGGSVSVGATVRLANAEDDATAGTATARTTVEGEFDVTLPITIRYDKDVITGDTTCWMSMAPVGWHWPGG